MDVAGFGESSIDHVYRVDGLPKDGRSKLRIIDYHSAAGGQVSTTMAACAALGVNAGYLGVVGDDANAALVEAALRERGVDITRMIRRPAPNRYAVILVDHESGDRIVLWERDERLNVPAAALDGSLIAGCRIVHVDGTDEIASIALARMARGAGLLVTCDIDDVRAQTAELLSLVSVPIFAEHVPRMLTGIDSIDSALRQLRTEYSGILCATLGAAGAVALDGDRLFHVAGLPVHAVDTTGAGDVFRAGIIYGILREWPAESMLRFANAAAAVSCTRPGAMSSVPALADVERQLR
jgi:sugar/nucleoside kinase (ribokinase family)